MTKLSRADVTAWVAAVYGTRDAEQWVAEGPAAFQVRLDDGRALLVRKRTGEYWEFSQENDLHKAWTDRRLRHALRKVTFDPDSALGVVHDPSNDVTWEQVQAWLDATYGDRMIIGQIIDRGWAFLATQGPIEYGGLEGRATATFAIIKRTGDVWDLMAGWHAEAAYYARTEAGFLGQIGALTSRLRPVGQVPR
ncbi:MAG: hypothetical protein M3422_21970 [Actinomycetota bacterium]|nr:hypothetical protein [Actinomycetota bacterium]